MLVYCICKIGVIIYLTQYVRHCFVHDISVFKECYGMILAEQQLINGISIAMGNFQSIQWSIWKNSYKMQLNQVSVVPEMKNQSMRENFSHIPKNDGHHSQKPFHAIVNLYPVEICIFIRNRKTSYCTLNSCTLCWSSSESQRLA